MVDTAPPQIVYNPVYAEPEKQLAERLRIISTATRTAEEIAEDKRQPASARVASARLLAEIAGAIGAGRTQDRKPDAPLSSAELRAIVDRLEREISDRAKSVEAKQPDPDAHLFE